MTPPGFPGTAEELGTAIANSHRVVQKTRRRTKLDPRLRRLEKELDRVDRRLREGAFPLPTFAEWVLDNQYILAEAVAQVRIDLPPSFQRELPVIDRESGGRVWRIFAIAEEFVSSSEGHVDSDGARALLSGYQSVTPLTMGELWAFPAVLRLALLENLVDATLTSVGSSSALGGTPTQRVDGHTDRIPAIIHCLREAAREDWSAFFEAVSLVERTLESDPSGVYPRMDFRTRDQYRKAVETVARRFGREENEVANEAVRLAREKAEHVGHFLLGPGRRVLDRKRNRAGKYRFGFYLLCTLALTSAMLATFLYPLPGSVAEPWHYALGVVLGIVPAVTVATAVVNWLVTRRVSPRSLPKMDYDDGLPDGVRAFVVVPTLLTDKEEIENVLRTTRLNYEGNADPNLRFVLLTDLVDAPGREMPEDAELITAVAERVRRFNRHYGVGDQTPLLLLHRDRTWNEAEGCWMGWERKRGKLEDFNRLVLGEQGVRFSKIEGSLEDLTDTRYVITLDADTFLPQGAARRLVATLDHPLNRPRFGETGTVERGYTVLQPRIETLQPAASKTLFGSIFKADRGLDLYSHAVSNVYQDLFGVGIFAGKGIYDVAAFHRSLVGRVPENALLSHDLFEGLHGRAGLVTDVAVFEEFPEQVVTYARRLHRWVRGDWQIARWLFPRVPGSGGTRLINRISWLGRWQILDNLRRSLVHPTLMLLMVAGWLVLPGGIPWWTAVVAIVLGIPVLLGTNLLMRPHAMLSTRWAPLIGAGRLRAASFLRWGFAFAFLPYQALVELDAIIRTWFRVIVTRRRLLEWTTAAQTARLVKKAGWKLRGVPGAGWALGTVVILTLFLWFQAPGVILFASPALALWLFAPLVAVWVSRPFARDPRGVPPEGVRALRVLALRTWSFFEDFVGAEDHWLPPDHYQEEPNRSIAHRTSPTNIGLFLTSALSAFDFGYLTVEAVSALLSNTLDGMARLKKHRGHLLNWYDTRSLTPLAPEYVSTVDSGNLAAALVCVARGCEALPDHVLPRDVTPAIADGLEVLRESLEKLSGARQPLDHGVGGAMRAIEQALESGAENPRDLATLQCRLAEGLIPELEQCLSDFVGGLVETVDPEAVAEVRSWMMRLHRQAQGAWQETLLILPWLSWSHEPPPEISPSSDELQLWIELGELLPERTSLREIPEICSAARALLESRRSSSWAQAARSVEEWLNTVDQTLLTSAQAAEGRLNELAEIQTRADRFVREMDFRFLYDRTRSLFRIGYNLAAGQPDTSYYDLLASEARIASLMAIAKGDVPAEHWLHLGRPFGRVHGRALLLSWAGTSFEYLMPSLVSHVPEGSLLDLTCEAAIRAQVRFGLRNRVPWGISESGYHHLDTHGTYQYRAFGVPGLGLRRETWDRLVVSPYASLLALSVDPEEVFENVRRFKTLEMAGRYGLYEAADFGRSSGSARPQIVRSFMAHHQGMILAALNNFLNPGALPDRFHADARVASVEFLLSEGAPERVRLEPPRPAPGARPPQLTGPPMIHPWAVAFDEVRPEVQVLSNGRLSTLITSRGGGGMQWRGVQITRWSPDPTRVDGGQRIYIQDLADGRPWCPTPAGVSLDHTSEPEVHFSPHQAEFQSGSGEIAARLTIAVVPGVDLEIRRLLLINQGVSKRRLRITSYDEVVLAQPQEARRHIAFQKLFVESDFLHDERTLMCQRRRRYPEESPIVLGHTVLVRPEVGEFLGWESDRNAFIGRGGSLTHPEALRGSTSSLGGSIGAGLDPICSLQVQVDLPSGQSTEVIFLTAVGRSRRVVLKNLDSYRSWAKAGWAFEEARVHTASLLQGYDLSPRDARLAQSLLSVAVHPYHNLRTLGSRDRWSPAARPELWSLGVSGDYPVILLKVAGVQDRLAVEELLRIHGYLQHLGVMLDLVVLDESSDVYAQPLQDWLERRVMRFEGGRFLRVPGGVYPVFGGRLSGAQRDSLEHSAAVVIDASRGSLDRCLEEIHRYKDRLPPFVPVPASPAPPSVEGRLPPRHGFLFDNGIGGFAPDGSEYVIRIEPGGSTPAPWINVIAYPGFGFTVSERGAGFTWVGNSGEQRVTTWTNDPVLDTSGEALYFRDEETGEIWSPTPGPRPGPGPYDVRHGVGLTSFQHVSHGLDQQVRFFAHPRDTVKVVEVEVRNEWSRHRRLTLTYYAEWVLGSRRDVTGPHIETEFDGGEDFLLARNRFSEGMERLVGLLASDQRVHGWTCDREEFLGAFGGLEDPEGLRRIGLAGATGRGLDPCGALQVHIDLGPEERRLVRFFLGAASGSAAARTLVRRLRVDESAAEAMKETHESWSELLSVLSVDTPDPSMNVLLNRWLLYQTVSCRLDGRTALYQSSGAFGFRDQLQDVLALLLVAPDRARTHILTSAAHQFVEGDVLHWWHPPGDFGVRTRCSDDLLWLPLAVAEYVKATGDEDILAEEVPFLEGPGLSPGQEELAGHFGPAGRSGTLYEHCVLALQRGLTQGPHGLPLIGTFDWNDGLNRVGPEGRGESVWLAWFGFAVASSFAQVSEKIGLKDDARWLRHEANRLRDAAEASGWDGDWYLRAYYDDGTPLGSAESEEGRIDSIPQSWAAISGGADPDRTRMAVDCAMKELLDREHGLMLLLKPPFDRTELWPGYIKAYPPGVRENGGQYSHAAAWMGIALAALGDGDRAWEVFRVLDPIRKASTEAGAAVYRVEPYVMAGDVAGAPPHSGKGGWTWYTGSAAWTYRLGMEAILGIRPEAGGLRVDPCIPHSWKEFQVVYQKLGTTYRIQVRNPEGVSRGVREVTIDGRIATLNFVPLDHDGGEHEVVVVLGPEEEKR